MSLSVLCASRPSPQEAPIPWRSSNDFNYFNSAPTGFTACGFYKEISSSTPTRCTLVRTEEENWLGRVITGFNVTFHRSTGDDETFIWADDGANSVAENYECYFITKVLIDGGTSRVYARIASTDPIQDHLAALIASGLTIQVNHINHHITLLRLSSFRLVKTVLFIDCKSER